MAWGRGEGLLEAEHLQQLGIRWQCDWQQQGEIEAVPCEPRALLCCLSKKDYTRAHARCVGAEQGY
jgi:hypothetical protein